MTSAAFIPPDMSAQAHQAWHVRPGTYAAGPDPARWGRATVGWPPHAVVIVDRRVHELDIYRTIYRTLGAVDVYRSPVPDAHGDPIGHLKTLADHIEALAAVGRVVVAGDEHPVAAVTAALLINSGEDTPAALAAYQERGTAFTLPEDWQTFVKSYALLHTPTEARARRIAEYERDATQIQEHELAS